MLTGLNPRHRAVGEALKMKRSLRRPPLVLWYSARGFLGGLGAAVLLAGTASITEASTPPPPFDGPAQMARARECARRGDFENALAAGRRAATAFRTRHDAGLEIDALVAMSESFRALGQIPRAVHALEAASALVEASRETRRAIAVRTALATLLPVNDPASQAEDLLKATLAQAQSGEPQDTRAVAAILNNLGNLLAAQRIFGEALERYTESATLAGQAGDDLLAAEALANAASAAVRNGAPEAGVDLNYQTLDLLERLEMSHTQAILYLKTALTFQSALDQRRPVATSWLAAAGSACRQATNIATVLGDDRTLACAWSMMGELYERDRQPVEALRWGRRAAFKSRQAGAPEAELRSEWNTGRLLRAEGRLAEALPAYERAAQAVQDLQGDCGSGYGFRDVESSFREETGRLFYEMADVILRQAASGDAGQGSLRQAQLTLERLRYAELRDYFHDECLDRLRAQTVSLGTPPPDTAVAYFIPLPDRLELLLSLPAGLRRFTLALDERELASLVKAWRSRLEDPAAEPLAPAQSLYRSLIAPIRQALADARISTLVFVPDGALRLVPLGALHDGRQFLAEAFATAIVPGLTLLDPQPLSRRAPRLLLCALSEAVQGFPALDQVRMEARNAQTNFPAKTLLDQDFRAANVERALGRDRYSIVHIAAHGQFARESRRTFLLTYDSRLTGHDLERLLRPNQAHGQPVELLVLSGCETAAGDDRAALGLAGVALQAGARSALATLWRVHDEASALLISEFYAQLKRHPLYSRAQALQAAQLKLIAHPRYGHPYFWSAYLLIGSWL